MPEVQLEYSATEREIDQLRAAHPNLLRKLEAQFWKVHPTAQATTGNLVDFAYQHDLLLTANRTPANSAAQTIGQNLMIFEPPRRIAGTARARPVNFGHEDPAPFLLAAFAPLAQPPEHSAVWFHGSLVIGRFGSGANEFRSELELWNGVKHSGDRHRLQVGETGLESALVYPRIYPPIATC
jgi:hypothetical protein